MGHNDIIVEKVINIERNSRSSVSKLSTESVGIVVANFVHTANATQLDSLVESGRAL